MLIIFFLISPFSSTGQEESSYSLHESIGYASTAFNLQKGESRINTTNLLLYNYTKGIKDNLSFSLGVAPFIQTVRIKYSYQASNYLRFGITPLIGYAGEDEGFFSELIGALTIGTPNTYFNITYSKVYPKPYDRTENNISLGFSLRLSEKFWLTSENHLMYNSLPLNNDFWSFNNMSIKWLKKKNQQLQLGIYLPRECWVENYYYPEPITERYCEISPIPIPVISYSIYFGLK